MTAVPERILVLDDQFGRCGLGERFKESVAGAVFASYVADRRALCRNFGLVDITGDSRTTKVERPLARAVFSPAQRWNSTTEQIENDADTARSAVRRGWPFADGGRWALVLVDLRFSFGALNAFGDPVESDLFGLRVLLPSLAAEFGPDLPLVVLSSTRREENNAPARAAGALDFLQRLPEPGASVAECRSALQRVLHLHGLIPDATGQVIGSSLATLKMLRQARRAAAGARTVLLRGESGSGKGLLARFIHQSSSRRERPFEYFNAAYRTSELQADELFGHWRGAFTDAHEDRPGLWERADGGTVFIDEVADLDPAVQARLMQPIDERVTRRVGPPPKGMQAEKPIDVLVILASNRSLETLARIKGDFLNRISAFVLDVPPLRARSDDIPDLAAAVAHQIDPAWKGAILPEAMDSLRRHPWLLGNVRELRNVLERALTNAPAQDVTARDLEFHGSSPVSESHLAEPSRESLDLLRRALSAPPSVWTVERLQTWRNDLAGTFLDLCGDCLGWALSVTRVRNEMNLTEAARLLAGDEALTTTEAKRFLRRIVLLDRGGRRLITAASARLPGHGLSVWKKLGVS